MNMYEKYFIENVLNEELENNKIQLNKEILTEDTIVKDTNENNLIIVTGDGQTFRNYGDDPYFKLLNHQDYKTADKMIRISILEPKYIYHEDNDGKEIWNLKNSDKKYLNKILSKKSKNNPSKTNWEYLLEIAYKYAINNAPNNYIKEGRYEYIKSLPKPNYEYL